MTFRSILTFTVGSIVDSKEAKAHEVKGDMGDGWLLDHSAGSGPYTVDHWIKEVEVLLKANPNHGGTQPSVANVLYWSSTCSNRPTSNLAWSAVTSTSPAT